MDPIGLLIVLIIIGVALPIVPMDPTIRRAVIAIILLLALLWLLRALGVWSAPMFGR